MDKKNETALGSEIPFKIKCKTLPSYNKMYLAKFYSFFRNKAIVKSPLQY